MGYDQGERLKMSRKVLKNWGRPLSHIFFNLRTPPIQAKIVEASPLPFLIHRPPPPIINDRSRKRNSTQQLLRQRYRAGLVRVLFI